LCPLLSCVFSLIAIGGFGHISKHCVRFVQHELNT
jgi:hypothetical protein